VAELPVAQATASSTDREVLNKCDRCTFSEKDRYEPSGPALLAKCHQQSSLNGSLLSLTATISASLSSSSALMLLGDRNGVRPVTSSATIITKAVRTSAIQLQYSSTRIFSCIAIALHLYRLLTFGDRPNGFNSGVTFCTVRMLLICARLPRLEVDRKEK